MTGLVLISGGGSGIGRDLALRLTAQSTPVMICGRRIDSLRRTAEAATPGLVEVVAADLSTPGGGDRVAAALGDRPVAGVVAAAGAAAPRHTPTNLAELDSRWTMMFRANLFTALFLVEASIPNVIDGRGRVVLVSSTAAFDGGGGPYAASKAAMHGYALDVARRLGPRGITANVVAPGHVPGTELVKDRNAPGYAEAIERVISGSLLGRAGKCSEVSSAIAFLLSEDAGWITGQIVSPNGGTALGR